MADYKDIKYNVDYGDTAGAGGLIKITFPSGRIIRPLDKKKR